ncbi:MAG TPA: HEAT repeat domain-containing protein [Thermosynechococcaceae cyanobacterium]
MKPLARPTSQYIVASLLAPYPIPGPIDDESDVVQINAAYALGQMGWMAESALPALSDRLEDENRVVTASADHAIGQIGSSLLKALLNGSMIL